MSRGFLPVDQYIIKNAIETYQAKYGKVIDQSNCYIHSIPAALGYKFGYKIEAVRCKDHVIINYYFTPNRFSQTHKVQLEVNKNEMVTGALGDEVVVILGNLSDYGDHYVFPWIKPLYMGLDLAGPVDECTPFVFMDGSPIAWISGDLAGVQV